LTKKRTKFEPGEYKVAVKRSKAGLGLFAVAKIPVGACIIEYVGRHISEKEKYIINSKYLFEVNSKITIDGKARSNLARYINHSCRPNAEVKIRKGRVFFMSRKNIPEGTEICFDYGKEYWDEYIKPHGCRCAKCAEKKDRVK
jgi:SET domain-containing protein